MSLMISPSTLLIASVAAAMVCLTVAAGLAIVAAIRAGGRREDVPGAHEALSVSRFTIPVSIVVPVSAADTVLATALPTLLGLTYPEFEVIVVAEAAPPESIASIVRDWKLEAKEFFYRRSIPTAEVHKIYRSARDSRLMVIDKAPGGYSDALNCGVNLARYRYVLSVGPDVALDADALLRVMAAPTRNPAQVVGASSHVEAGEMLAPERPGPRSIQAAGPRTRLTAALHRIASLRSLMESRLVWQHLGSGFAPRGTVLVWRRDAVLEAGGFSPIASEANLDMMFRLQAAGPGGASRFEVGSDVVGRVAALPVQRGRRSAAFRMLRGFLTGAGRGIEPRALAYFVASELVVSIAQIVVMAGTLAAAALGWSSWSTPALAVLALAFGNAAVTAAALLLRGASPNAPTGPELRRLLLAAPLATGWSGRRK